MSKFKTEPLCATDSDGDIHIMRKVANRTIALCGYLNLDTHHDYETGPAEPTCAACLAKAAKE